MEGFVFGWRRAGSSRRLWLFVLFALLLTAAGPGERRLSHSALRIPPSALVKIGLLLPPEGVAEGEAVRRGAELAVAEANRAGGYRGRPFVLVVRREEGAWGAGATHIADLATRERVWAILGSVDGRSAHLVEQVVTKVRLAFVSPWASDPTLSQINLPWFFRCVPDDRQQADALVGAVAARRLARVATLAETTYDARFAEDAFARSAQARGRTLAARFTLDPGASGADVDAVLARAARERIDGLVLFGRPERMARLVRRLPAAGGPVLFGPLPLADAAFARAVSDRGATAVVVAPGHLGAHGDAFRAAYRAAYGEAPAPAAAYAYDGLHAVVAAIRTAGLDRTKIRDALAATDLAGGATGRVRFDAKGNRVAAVTAAPVAE